jgi:hypothetical protein
LETSLTGGLTVFSFPAPDLRWIRTTNGLVRVSQKICQRTRGNSPVAIP